MKRWLLRGLASLAALLLGAVVAVGFLAGADHDVGRSLGVASAEKPVLQVAPAAVPVPMPTPEVVRDGLLRVPVVELSVPLGEVQVVDGVVNPPTSDAAYVVAGYGDPHGSGTVYVAMHSGRGVEAAGNVLIDVDAGQARVHAGDQVFVDGVPYVVQEVRLVEKAVLPEESDLWVPVDGRLVLFTCLQRPEGRSIQNVVVIAERES